MKKISDYRKHVDECHALLRGARSPEEGDAPEHGGDLGGAGGRARKETGERGEN